MAQKRRYGEDLTVAEWHRNALPELYERIGHRLHLADRDWTEFCYWCKETLVIWEEVRDRGQDLYDKGVSVTTRLAEHADIRAFVVAWRTDRSAEVQSEIDALHRRIRELEAQYPITGFRVRTLHPRKGPFVALSPSDFAGLIYLAHRDHHDVCAKAQAGREVPVKRRELNDAKAVSALWLPHQRRLR